GVAQTGVSTPAAPVAGGITDVGNVELTVAPVDCPCGEPTGWSLEFGSEYWQIFTTADFSEIVEYLTCSDEEDETALAFQVENEPIAFGVSADASSMACDAFSLIDGIPLEATHEIAPSQVEACREALRGVAQNFGVTCAP
ncbi:MAG: hypothetical protein GY725_00025, partial [bacterium]|nr:hypothetical protein [bacterium]